MHDAWLKSLPGGLAAVGFEVRIYELDELGINCLNPLRV